MRTTEGPHRTEEPSPTSEVATTASNGQTMTNDWERLTPSPTTTPTGMSLQKRTSLMRGTVLARRNCALMILRWKSGLFAARPNSPTSSSKRSTSEDTALSPATLPPDRAINFATDSMSASCLLNEYSSARVFHDPSPFQLLDERNAVRTPRCDPHHRFEQRRGLGQHHLTLTVCTIAPARIGRAPRFRQSQTDRAYLHCTSSKSSTGRRGTRLTASIPIVTP